MGSSKEKKTLNKKKEDLWNFDSDYPEIYSYKISINI